MNRIFFSSSYWGGNGPNIVNRNLVENFPPEVSVLKFRRGLFMRLETVFKILWCRVLIISGLGQKDYEVAMAKKLGKKIIYIMHGFAEDDSDYFKARQDFLFPRADLILCVSSKFKDLVGNRYPELEHKLSILYNGIAWERMYDSIKEISVKRDINEIAIIGGGRFIKKNLNVCKAVRKINEESNMHLHVSVYGRYCDDDESKAISDIDCVSFVGLVSHQVLLERLCASSLLVQASLSESFGLSVVEALVCGCDIVVSKNVGAIGVVPAIKETEVIQDSEDIEEIAARILYVIRNSNSARLLNSIDKKKTSLKTAALKLVNISNSIV